MAVPEATRRETKYGTVYDGEGWFVLNARETRWRDSGHFGFFCDFEGKRRFRQLGINLSVLEPGQPLSMYHRENAQEGFLVIAGECVVLVEDEERRMRAWDYFHCPGGTAHVVVGAGDGPAVVLAVGARGGREGFVYPVDPLAVARAAGVERETTKPGEAYARFPRWVRTPYRDGWLPDFESLRSS
ncbi:MAG TPA: cupin domain-containing protein [Gaiellaceae bacterium]|nr:cupin domain-containing protein [Gaiellaceae bacterium]